MRPKFFIPANHADPGYVFNGTIAKRNAAEGIVMGIGGLILCHSLPFVPHNLDGISWYVMFFCAPLMIGAVGIQGDPVSTFLIGVFKWLRRRKKPYIYNTHGRGYSISSAELLLEQPQLRDRVADFMDKLSARMGRKRIDYVEGETFQFEDDPEMSALSDAEEYLHEQEEKEAPENEQNAPEEPTEPAAEPERPMRLDLSDIIEGDIPAARQEEDA